MKMFYESKRRAGAKHLVMIRKLFLFLLLVLASLNCLAADDKPQPVKVPAGIDHSSYDRLLKKYVDNQGLVAYAKWQGNREDMATLDKYLRQFAGKEKEAEGDEKAADLINAYNGFTLQWILKHYPTESIWELDDSFTARRHTMAGRQVSLNDIEKGSLIPQIGWKDHGVLVCAARSCPPLQRGAYRADELGGQIARAFRGWLDRPDLNEYLPQKNKVEISSIFKWFEKDFAKAGGAQHILDEFGPAKFHDFLAREKYEIDYKPYNWGLNDQGPHGRNYSKADLIIDKIF